MMAIAKSIRCPLLLSKWRWVGLGFKVSQGTSVAVHLCFLVRDTIELLMSPTSKHSLAAMTDETIQTLRVSGVLQSSDQLNRDSDDITDADGLCDVLCCRGRFWQIQFNFS